MRSWTLDSPAESGASECIIKSSVEPEDKGFLTKKRGEDVEHGIDLHPLCVRVLDPTIEPNVLMYTKRNSYAIFSGIV